MFLVVNDPVPEAAALEARHGHLPPQDIIARTTLEIFPGSVAGVSSFGAESAVLLHMIADVDKDLPVLFLDTGKHFEETLGYRDALISDFGLRNVISVHPDAGVLAKRDPDGMLHGRDPDACCNVRKVGPLANAMRPYRAWFTGRKQFQTSVRQAMPVFESVNGRVRINPLARWKSADLADYTRRHKLRENPLVPYGYRSIGCFPCTQPVKAGDDPRSGRWAGYSKTECGIHLSEFAMSVQGPKPRSDEYRA